MPAACPRPRWLLLLALFLSPFLQAEVFQLTASSGGVSQSRGYTTVDEVLDGVTNAGLAGLLPGYTGSEVTNMALDFRGVDVSLAYPLASSPELILNIPSIGTNQSFNGIDRDESQNLMKDFFKKNPTLLALLQQELVKSSPIDPVAGNPGSMMSRGAAQDFDSGLVTAGQASGQVDDEAAGFVGFTPSYARLVSKSVNNPRDMDSGVVSLPLSYTRLFKTKGRVLSISAPFSQADVEGAKAYDLGLAASFRNPVTPAWFLAVTGGVRATGSPDLGSGVAMGNVALTSSYVIPGDKFGFTIGNMAGYYSAMKVKVNNVVYDPDISNTVFRNGVLVEQLTGFLWGKNPLTIEYSLVDTRYTGTALFNDYQDEFGFTVGTRRAGNARASSMRGGLSFVEAPQARGVSLSFGYWF